MQQDMTRTTVSFRCTENLLEDLDGIADNNYMDRTGVIIQAVLNYLRKSQGEEADDAAPQKKESV